MTTLRLHLLAVACACLSAPALAADFAYMNNGEPWGVQSNVDNMNATFGAGNWDKVGFGADISGYKFVYIDGGDQQGAGFRDYVTANAALLEAYVMQGGRLFLNAASNGLSGQTYGLIFGATTREGAYSSVGTAVDPQHPLFAGAGSSWTGGYFSHNALEFTGGGYTSFIVGSGGQSLLAGGAFGAGYALLGGQTSSHFHASVDGSNPFRLRVNELAYAANVVSAVPEPAGGTLLLAGLAALGTATRRRRPAA